MSSLPQIEILLATFNGDRFLREQIDSILTQDYENIRVLARDDGSTDGTRNILQEYAERFPERFQVMPAGAPTGNPKANFLLLMKASTAEYVCLADQDDVWLPDKVSKTKSAMDRLESRWGKKLPLLVFTDLHLVDEHLRPLDDSLWAHMGIVPERIHQLSRLMVHSVVTGCTTMMNRRLVEASLHMPEETYMHDAWIAWVATYLGKTSIVREQTVLYRQHDRNVVGTGTGLNSLEVKQPPRSVWEKIRRPRIAIGYVIRWDMYQRHAAAFLREHGGELSARKRYLIKAFLRCQTSRSRVVRVATLVLHGFYYVGLKPNLALMFYLWRMNGKTPATV